MRKLAILPYTLLSSLIIRFLRKFYQNAHRLNGRVLEKAVKITTGTQMPFGVFISQSNRCFCYTVKLLAEFDIFSSICVEDMDLPVSFAIIRNDKKKTIFLCQSPFYYSCSNIAAIASNFKSVRTKWTGFWFSSHRNIIAQKDFSHNEHSTLNVLCLSSFSSHSELWWMSLLDFITYCHPQAKQTTQNNRI